MLYGKKKKHEEKMRKWRLGEPITHGWLWLLHNQHKSENIGGRVYSAAAFIVVASATSPRDGINTALQL
jgi:hypothetical protein